MDAQQQHLMSPALATREHLVALEADLHEAQRAYVTAAVTEIASLRAELDAPLVG
jgi:hypothetical protein